MPDRRHERSGRSYEVQMVATLLTPGCGIMTTLPAPNAVAPQPQVPADSDRFVLASLLEHQANQQLRCNISGGLRVASALLSLNTLTHFRSERP